MSWRDLGRRLPLALSFMIWDGATRHVRWGAFTFNEDDTDLLQAFNKNLKAVHRTDKWKETLKHYGLDDHSIDEVDAKTTKQLCNASSS